MPWEECKPDDEDLINWSEISGLYQLAAKGPFLIFRTV